MRPTDQTHSPLGSLDQWEDFLKQRYPQSDYAARAESIAYRVGQQIPVYGNDRE